MPPSPSVGTAIMALLETHHLLSAPDVLAHLHQTKPGINKTTVYRALDKLLVEGKVCRQHLNDNHIVYELRTHHHDHLVCNHCGKVTPTECQVHVEHVQNFQVDHHHLTLYGTCENCQQQPTAAHE